MVREERDKRRVKGWRENTHGEGSEAQETCERVGKDTYGEGGKEKET